MHRTKPTANAPETVIELIFCARSIRKAHGLWHVAAADHLLAIIRNYNIWKHKLNPKFQIFWFMISHRQKMMLVARME